MANKKMNEQTQRDPDAGHTFEDYVKRALNPLLVLQLLQEESMYVYQMQQEMANRSNGRYKLSLLYPVLYRLCKLNYVQEGEKRISEDNRVRQYYEITPAGREHLRDLKKQLNELMGAVQGILECAPEVIEDGEIELA